MSTIRWINGKQGSLLDAANWIGGVAPGAGDTAVISSQGDGAPTLSDNVIDPPANGSAVDLCGALDRVTLVPVGGTEYLFFQCLQADQVAEGDTVAGGTIDLIGAGSETTLNMQDSALAAATTTNVSGAGYIYANYTNVLGGTINIGLPFTVGGQTVTSTATDPHGFLNDLDIDVQAYGSWTDGATLASYIPSAINDGTINVAAGSALTLNLHGHDGYVLGIYFSATSRSEFDNQGTIAVAAGGTLVADNQGGHGIFVNNGVIAVTGAAGATTSVAIGASYSGSGVLDISGGTQANRALTTATFTDVMDGSEISIADATVVLNAGDKTPSTGPTYADGGIVFADAAGTLQLIVFPIDSAVNVFHDTISGFHAGDNLQLTYNAGFFDTDTVALRWDQATQTLSLYNTAITSFQAPVKTLAAQFVLEGTYAANSFSISNLKSDRNDNVSLTITTTSPLTGPQTYTLTQAPADITGGAGNDTFIATAGALQAGDRIDGSGGVNTLELTGAGSFDLTAPTVLADIQTVTASEAQPGQQQVVTLRAGLDLAVAAAAASPKTAGITIQGAANNDVITLAGGADTVVLGGDGETVHGGGGADRFYANAASIGATIDGGTGASTLDLTGGGTLAMGANITRIAAVVLNPAAQGATQPAYVFTANALVRLAITGSGGADTITPGAASQSIDAHGGAVRVLATAATAGVRITGAPGALLEIAGGGTAALNAASNNIHVALDAATRLTLSRMAFVTATGSAGNDTIIAGAAGQVLTGGLGADTLIGLVTHGITFMDTAAGLSGDTIENFGVGDLIDITDLSPTTSLFKLSATGNAKATTLGVTDGTHGASIRLTGAFTDAHFITAADGHGGLTVTYSGP